MVLKQSLFLLMFVLVLPGAERSLQEVTALLDQGKTLTRAEAEILELKVVQKPKEEKARLRLLGYYESSPVGLDLAIVKQQLLKHIRWIVQNDPDRGLGAFPFIVSGVTCDDGPLANRDGFDLIRRDW